MARIVAVCPEGIVHADLDDATDEQLRVLADWMEAERDRYAALGFVGEVQA